MNKINLDKKLVNSSTIANIVIWGGGSAAIIYAIKKTGSAKPLWAFLLFPVVLANKNESVSEN